MKRWEHQVIELPLETVGSTDWERRLLTEGFEGWELVSTQYVENEGLRWVFAFMKRELHE